MAGKIKAEDILKPGAVIKARKLSHKEIAPVLERVRKAQDHVLSLMDVDPKTWKLRVTI